MSRRFKASRRRKPSRLQGSGLPRGGGETEARAAPAIPAVGDDDAIAIEVTDADADAVRALVDAAHVTVRQETLASCQCIDDEERGDAARGGHFFLRKEELLLIREGLVEGTFHGDAEIPLLRGVLALGPVVRLIPVLAVDELLLANEREVAQRDERDAGIEEPVYPVLALHTLLHGGLERLHGNQEGVLFHHLHHAAEEALVVSECGIEVAARTDLAARHDHLVDEAEVLAEVALTHDVFGHHTPTFLEKQRPKSSGTALPRNETSALGTFNAKRACLIHES